MSAAAVPIMAPTASLYEDISALPEDPHIRLLTLLPAVGLESPVQCKLSTYRLKSATDYTALSYVWGQVTKEYIECDGVRLDVTDNQMSALRHIRDEEQAKLLWVDSICIDQGNSERQTRERKSQVQMMGDIYESASRVIVWLGPAHQYTPMVFHILRMTGLVTYWSRKYHLGWCATKPLYLRISSRFECTV